ncbi:TonB-dependent receptor [Sphingopyxis sp. H050]|jgi:iron complex outermembrane recepter protein|uniref:TonB-dependent receptor n=1 Tax=Sphingopyxis sp. H050 TaxID=1759072 RepID=UPI000736BECB|nr:TonB-dependent receptor [Sphingopyxis sp. H050]KTE22785.1 TonB-dependent receptor [Sphingopyxis sp. H050]
MIRGSLVRGSRGNINFAAALLGSTALAMLAVPAFAQGTEAHGTDETGDEAIVVTGIRSSLATALGEKRTSDNIVEVIQAEDIGKLPDQNLAEVLENVTGVQITRQAGVGNAVQIRGTDANRTEINGVSTVGSGAGRSGISFEDLPAALIASVEVTKVPTAQTIEGSVGGTINLRTIRPLDLKDPLIAARAQMENSDLSKTTLPRLSATLGNRWDTGIGEIGIVVSGSYARQDVASFRPRVDRDAVVLPGSGPSAEAFPFLRIQFLQQGLENLEYETYNGTAALEWKPNDDLKFYFDATLNNQQRGQQSHRVQVSGTATPSVVDAMNNTDFETVDFGTLDGPNGPIDLGSVQAAVAGTIGIGGSTGTVIDPNLRMSSDTGARVTKSRVFDLGTEWQITEKLHMRAEASLSTSKSDFPNFSTTLDFINPRGPQPVIGRSIDNGVPLEFDLRNGTLQFGIDQASPFAPSTAELLDPANYQLQQVTQGANSTDNQERAARLDFTYDTTDLNPFVTSIDFGWRWNRTSAENSEFSNNVSLTNTTTAWNRPSGDLFSDILIPGPSNFNAADGRRLYFPDFLLIDGGLAFRDPASVLAALNEAIAASNAARTQGPAVASLATPTESFAGFFSIKETTNAAYFQANMEGEIAGMPVRGNAGFRWLRTRLSSTGNNIANGTVTGQTVAKSNYNFLLPRFSLVLEPADKLLVRAGIARDIRRPNFDTLSTSFSFGTGANTPVAVGNPDLVPEAVWSFDLSGEYYFAPSSLVSIGFFHKSRTNLFAQRQEDPAPNLDANGNLNISIDPACPGGGIYNPIANRNINNPVQGVGICVPRSSTFNVPGSTTQTGIEVAFQHDLSAWEDTLGFASGFGVIGNFTYQKTGGSAREYRVADGPRTVFTQLGFPNSRDLITLTNLSKYAYNATLFYDKYGLNARLRYTWRSSYVSNDPFFFGLPLINGARGQLNASINYDITDNINVGVEGINLLRGDQNQYCVNNKALLCFQGLTDRRVTAGVSVKF